MLLSFVLADAGIMEIDTVIRWFVVALLSAGMFLGWLLLLAGNSALQRVCTNDCRYVTGFTWWIVWAQLFIFLASLPVQVSITAISIILPICC